MHASHLPKWIHRKAFNIFNINRFHGAWMWNHLFSTHLVIVFFFLYMYIFKIFNAHVFKICNAQSTVTKLTRIKMGKIVQMQCMTYRCQSVSSLWVDICLLDYFCRYQAAFFFLSRYGVTKPDSNGKIQKCMLLNVNHVTKFEPQTIHGIYYYPENFHF